MMFQISVVRGMFRCGRRWGPLEGERLGWSWSFGAYIVISMIEPKGCSTYFP